MSGFGFSFCVDTVVFCKCWPVWKIKIETMKIFTEFSVEGFTFTHITFDHTSLHVTSFTLGASRLAHPVSCFTHPVSCFTHHALFKVSRLPITHITHISITHYSFHDCVTRFTPCPSRLPIHTCVSRTTNSILHAPNNFKTASHYFNNIAKHFQWNKFLPQKIYSNYWSNETARKSSRSN